MNRQRWLRTRQRLAKAQHERALPAPGQVIEVDPAKLDAELKEVLTKPYADYVPDMPWERR